MPTLRLMVSLLPICFEPSLGLTPEGVSDGRHKRTERRRARDGTCRVEHAWCGDVVYNQCRMYVGDTTPESRKNWIADLDRLAALNPAIVVAGHKKPGAPDSPSTIQDTKHYLEDFDRLQKTATSGQALFDQMTELYPHWVANQSWLMFGFPGA